MTTETSTDTARFIYTPTESFTADVDGVSAPFTPNVTLVDEGHWLLAKYPHLFKRLRVHYTVEQATAAPGERRAR